MVMYFWTEFLDSNDPHNFGADDYVSFFLTRNLSDISLYFSLVLVALDWKQLEVRKLRFNFFVAIICLAGIYFVPKHNAGELNIHIDVDGFSCPAFCKGDIVEHDMYDSRVRDLSAGEHVILGYYHSEGYYLTKILFAGPHEEVCAEDSGSVFKLPPRNIFCDKFHSGEFIFDILTLGGPKPEFKSLDEQDVSMTPKTNVYGINLKKIGNIQPYFIYSDRVSTAFGHFLLRVYQLTGFNFFSAPTHSLKQ